MKRQRYDQALKFGPWCAALALGAPTPGLTSGEVSRSGQEKVPGRILIEGIT